MTYNPRRWINAIRNRLAKKLVAGRCELSVATTSRVSYTGISGRPPAKLSIGSGCIVECRIVSDRANSSVSIGDNTFIGSSLIVCAERVAIGSDVLISWGCTIVDHDSHGLEWRQRAHDVADTLKGTKDWTHVSIKPVFIGDKAWIGFNSVILKGVSIGEGAIVGAGSVVTKDVAPYTVVAGNPARAIRHLAHEDLIDQKDLQKPDKLDR